MKKLLVVFALVFATGLTMNAQEEVKGKGPGKGVKSTPEQRAQKSVDNLDKVVTLTAEQKPKVYDLALTRAKKVDEIRTSRKPKVGPKLAPEEKEAMKKEVKAVQKEYRAGVKAILTQEQKDKLKAKAKEKKAERKDKMPKVKDGANNDVTEDDIDEIISPED